MQLQHLKKTDSEVFNLIKKELDRQQSNIELIASENFTSLAVMEAQGTVLTNKYVEGLPKKDTMVVVNIMMRLNYLQLKELKNYSMLNM